MRTDVKVALGALALVLLADICGALGWIHPRNCPACGLRYHRGASCDWKAAADAGT